MLTLLLRINDNLATLSGHENSEGFLPVGHRQLMRDDQVRVDLCTKLLKLLQYSLLLCSHLPLSNEYLALLPRVENLPPVNRLKSQGLEQKVLEWVLNVNVLLGKADEDNFGALNY